VSISDGRAGSGPDGEHGRCQPVSVADFSLVLCQGSIFGYDGLEVRLTMVTADGLEVRLTKVTADGLEVRRTNTIQPQL
jgi:hypothetical protein